MQVAVHDQSPGTPRRTTADPLLIGPFPPAFSPPPRRPTLEESFREPTAEGIQLIDDIDSDWRASTSAHEQPHPEGQEPDRSPISRRSES